MKKLLVVVVILLFLTLVTTQVIEKFTYDRMDRTITGYQQLLEHSTNDLIQMETEVVDLQMQLRIAKSEVHEVFVYKTVEVIKEVPIPVELLDWQSLEELRAFLKEDDTDTGVSEFVGTIYLDGSAPCGYYAKQLRNRAAAQGKYLTPAELSPYDFTRWYSMTNKSYLKYHTVCIAFIGNEVWYVEPQSDDYWLANYLD